MTKQYISYEQYTKQELRIKQLRALGVEFIHKISKIKLILGSACLVVAIVPNGAGLIFYPLGFSLLASAGVDLYTLMEDKKRKLRVLKNKVMRWARC